MPELATGEVPTEAGVPGGGGHVPQSGSQLPQLPGNLGSLQRRFGL